MELSPSHGACVIVAVSSGFVCLWAGIKVGLARKRLGVKYPTMYLAEDHKHANEFNCVQRAHQNILENYPYFLVLLFFSAIEHPAVAAVAGLVRLAGFVAYARGYATGDPKKRSQGFFGYFGLLTMLVLSIKFGVGLMMK